MDKAAAKRRRKAKEEDKKGDGESMDKDPFSKKSKRAEVLLTSPHPLLTAPPHHLSSS